jgi:ATP-dependent exoDNAse (exonuclease V) beta subunit
MQCVSGDYMKKKNKQKTLDFDDLLVKTKELLETNADVRKSFKQI